MTPAADAKEHLFEMTCPAERLRRRPRPSEFEAALVRNSIHLFYKPRPLQASSLGPFVPLLRTLSHPIISRRRNEPRGALAAIPRCTKCLCGLSYLTMWHVGRRYLGTTPPNSCANIDPPRSRDRRLLDTRSMLLLSFGSFQI